MNNNLKYNRIFIMMNEYDKGFGINGSPTGYVKVEIKEAESKAFVYIKNIRLTSENKVLKSYLLCSSNKSFKPIYMGILQIKDGNSNLTYKFSEYKIKVEDASQYDTIVIMCKDELMENAMITFPLIGYKNHEWNWKKAFEKEEKINLIENKILIKEKKVEEKEKTTEKEELIEKEEIIEEKIIERETKEEEKIEIKEKERTNKSQDNFINYMSRYTEQQNPFINGDMKYKWWKVVDCDNFINQLCSDYSKIFNQYSYSAVNSLMIINNRYVIYTANRYGHFLIGTKRDEQKNIKYISYAIPARYGTEPHPFLHIHCYTFWIPKNGEQVSAGSLGYWIVNINTEDGKLSILEESN